MNNLDIVETRRNQFPLRYFNPLAESGMNIVKLVELKTDNVEFRQMPSYWDTRDIPKYLYIKARKT